MLNKIFYVYVIYEDTIGNKHNIKLPRFVFTKYRNEILNSFIKNIEYIIQINNSKKNSFDYIRATFSEWITIFEFLKPFIIYIISLLK